MWDFQNINSIKKLLVGVILLKVTSTSSVAWSLPFEKKTTSIYVLKEKGIN